MHEVSLAAGILKVAEEAAQREKFARVTLLRLEVGALSGVEVSALRFALEAMAPGTCLREARFEIDMPAGQAWCMQCSATVPLAMRGDACPTCGSHLLQPTGGTELRVIEMIVEDN
ncbi:Hydrogenase maturation factor HypA (plasmid) [Cupriavidus necator]|uniref:hydrogenase maturation nickel metallochaperone HypA n=1 Tax=Cupriavidus necator TaxID=106590 RepID=UPI003F7380C3